MQDGVEKKNMYYKHFAVCSRMGNDIKLVSIAIAFFDYIRLYIRHAEIVYGLASALCPMYQDPQQPFNHNDPQQIPPSVAATACRGVNTGSFIMDLASSSARAWVDVSLHSPS